MNTRVRIPSRRTLPRWARRTALGLGLVASGLAALITLGAVIPAVPVLGYYATTWLGPRPLWYVVFGLLIAVGAVVAWRRGKRRTAVWTTVTSAVTAIGAATVLTTQLLYAHSQNVPLSAADVLAVDQPTAPPDRVISYDRVEGRTLRAGLWAPRKAHPQGKKPMVVWIHGGGFATGSRYQRAGDYRWLANHGYPVLSIDYRLTPPPRWKDASDDVVCAMSRLARLARPYGVDTSRTVLVGGSAGGSLALNVAYGLDTGRVASSCTARLPEPPVAVAGFYPAADLKGTWQDNGLMGYGREITEEYTGGTPARYPGRYAYASAVNRVRPGLMPSLLVTGASDHLIREPRVRGLADRLRQAHDPVRFNAIPYSDHAFDDTYHSIAGAVGRNVLLRFLNDTASRS
ncbi:alpha/beta fold hydrolase [Streptomyces sp. NPDC021098]|uniref:alpha/beta fold hydrolase n=1 Tax=unclassified Streptomyces TaxID=2593676 RepID=UPI0037943C8D